MKKKTTHSGDQRLALAVIQQAVEDARNPSIDLITKLEATEFLGGERAEIWYRMAGLDPRTLQSMIRIDPSRRAN